MTTRIEYKIVTHEDYEVEVRELHFQLGQGWVPANITVVKHGDIGDVTIWDNKRVEFVERVREKTE